MVRGLGVWDLGFRGIIGLPGYACVEFRGFGFRDLGFRVWGLGFKGLGFWV